MLLKLGFRLTIPEIFCLKMRNWKHYCFQGSFLANLHFLASAPLCRFVIAPEAAWTGLLVFPAPPSAVASHLYPTALVYISLHLLTFFSVPSAAHLSVPRIVRACVRCQQRVKSSTLGMMPQLISKDKSGGAVSPLKVQQAAAARRLLYYHEMSVFDSFFFLICLTHFKKNKRKKMQKSVFVYACKRGQIMSRQIWMTFEQPSLKIEGCSCTTNKFAIICYFAFDLKIMNKWVRLI